MLVWCAEIGVHANGTEFEKKMKMKRNGEFDILTVLNLEFF